MDAKIHHSAFRISKDSLSFVKQLFEKIGLEIIYEPKGEGWVMFKQGGNDIRIQFIEVSNKCISLEDKEESHIGFISDDPLKDIKEIELFARQNNIKFVQGSWSKQEHWFDLPDLFVDFVVEIMDKKILD